MSTLIKQKHVVLHALPAAWGHNKPLCALALRILESRSDVVVTYITSTVAYGRIIGEVKRWPSSRFEAVEARLNIIDITGPVVGQQALSMELESFEPAFAALHASASVTCLTSGKTISGLSAPTLAIVDPFTGYAFEAIRAVAGKSVSILAWNTANTGATVRLFGPAYLGGVVDPAMETTEGRAVWKQKISTGEPVKSRWRDCNGSVVNIPGIPPCFDYEWSPSSLTALVQVTTAIEMVGAIYMRESDGMICVSANAFEPEVEATAKEWFNSMEKPWYNVGPLSLDIPVAEGGNDHLASENGSIGTFLNRIQDEFGHKTLLYMSFGSIFWPEEQERLWAVVDGLITKRQPFLFSHPSPLQQFPDELKRKISDSGIAMDVSWAPQELILAHPVTGWFLTHGGWNSVQEAFLYRVPLIFWPFEADQPYNAMRMSSQRAAFQLLEVRTGEIGMRTPYKFKDSNKPAFTAASAQAEIEQLVEVIRGEEGSIVRKNFEAIAEAMNRTWDSPGGESRKNFGLMLETFL